MRTEEIAHRKCLVHYGGSATETAVSATSEPPATGATCVSGACPAVALIQLTARHEAKSLDEELRRLDSGVGQPFVFIGVVLDDWAMQLMPWSDEAVSRDADVGRHATDTLCYIESQLLPWLRARHGDLPCVLGGYSLGGLFALWASTLSGQFASVAAVSPSVWIKGWTGFAENHPTCASSVYLSLGDREEHARNRRMAAVGQCVRRQHELLLSQLPPHDTVLEWNRGGHFDDEAGRMARGFIWCVGQMAVKLGGS